MRYVLNKSMKSADDAAEMSIHTNACPRSKISLCDTMLESNAARKDAAADMITSIANTVRVLTYFFRYLLKISDSLFILG